VEVSFRLGKHIGRGRLSPEQAAVVERLERDEITANEAEKLLGDSLRVVGISIADSATDEAVTVPRPTAPARQEMSEEEVARRLVERIAAEVDAEMDG
jgi:hypothetical protein